MRSEAGQFGKEFRQGFVQDPNERYSAPSGVTVAHIGDGTACYYTYSYSEVDCDGTFCEQIFAEYRLPGRGSALRTSARAARLGGANLSSAGAIFECGDGSGFRDNGDGTGNWWPANDVPLDYGSGGCGGGGGGGGGGDSTFEQLITQGACYADPTLSCNSVMRGETVTCILAGQGATLTSIRWKFIRPNGDSITESSSVLTWPGDGVEGGPVTVSYSAGGVPGTRSASFSVTPSSWSWSSVVGGRAATGFEIDNCFVGFDDIVIGLTASDACEDVGPSMPSHIATDNSTRGTREDIMSASRRCKIILVSAATIVGPNSALCQVVRGDSAASHVAATIRHANRFSEAQRVLTQQVGAVTANKLDALADTLVAIVLSDSASDDATIKRNNIAITTLLIAGSGYQGGVLYSGAASHLFRIAMEAHEVGARAGAISGIAALPNTTAAIALLRQIATSSVFSAHVAIQELRGTLGKSGGIEVLHDLYMHNLVSEDTAIKEINWMAVKYGWTKKP